MAATKHAAADADSTPLACGIDVDIVVQSLRKRWVLERACEGGGYHFATLTRPWVRAHSQARVPQ